MMILKTNGNADIEVKSFGGGKTLNIYAELSANLDEIKQAVEGAEEISFYSVEEKDDGSIEERLSYKEYGAFSLKKVLGQNGHVELVFEKSSDEIKALKAENAALQEQVTELQLALVELYEGGLEE